MAESSLNPAVRKGVYAAVTGTVYDPLSRQP